MMKNMLEGGGMSYTQLPGEDGSCSSTTTEEHVHELKQYKLQRKRMLNLLLPSLITPLLVTIVLLIPWWFANHHRDHGESKIAASDCGMSAAEATQLGCKYDLMSFAWLPPACFDEELTQQFLGEKTWEWYQDPSARSPVSQEEVSLGNFEHLYVKWEYHLYHCVYMWRKMTRALEREVPLDAYIGDPHHTTHCSLQLLNENMNRNATNTMIYTKFPQCGGDHQGRLGWYRVINGHKVYRQPDIEETVPSDLREPTGRDGSK